MKKAKTKFAVIGLGHIGKRHAHFINQNPQAQLVAICEPNPTEKIFEVPYFNSINALLESNIDFDVASICTPNHLHATNSLKLLEKRKHILIEKPMALNKADCEKIIHKSLNVSRQVFCVMQNRYSPPAQWLKSIIEDNTLGTPLIVSVNCFWNRDDRYYRPNQSTEQWHGTIDKDGGTLFTQFSHFIDLLYWLFGDFKNIEAKFANFTHQHSIDFEDSGFVRFELGEKTIGTLNYSTAVWNQNFESTLTIIGTKGTVKVGGQYMDKVVYCHIENYKMPELPKTPHIQFGNYKGAAANHYHVIQNVIDVLNDDKEIATNALEGLKTVEIIERIYNQR